MFVLANRIFKGTGDRHISSAEFWRSDLGQVCAQSFAAVTADTFDALIQASQTIRERNEKNGCYVFYGAYGYHGTEILLQNRFQWQSYVPYQQGHAKKRLEYFSRTAQAAGVRTTVFNCPEIRTNSSSIFSGVELPLFPMLKTLQKLHPSQWSQTQWEVCQQKLQPSVSLADILLELEECLLHPALQRCFDFANWPAENTRELTEKVVGLSDKISLLHQTKQDLISDYLSNLILEASGCLIFDYASCAELPVVWLGHDIITQKLAQLHP